MHSVKNYILPSPYLHDVIYRYSMSIIPMLNTLAKWTNLWQNKLYEYWIQAGLRGTESSHAANSNGNLYHTCYVAINKVAGGWKKIDLKKRSSDVIQEKIVVPFVERHEIVLVFEPV